MVMWPYKLLSVCGVVVTLAACSSSGGPGDLDLGSSKAEGLAGNWCGKQVTRAEDCRGDEVMYLAIAEVSGPSAYAGQVCEAFQKDCLGADFGAVTSSKAEIAFGTGDKRFNATLYPSADRASVRMVIDAKGTYPGRDLLLFKVTVGGS